MEKIDLTTSVDDKLSEDFDSIVLADFCSNPGLAVKSIETSTKHNVGYENKDIWRSIKVEVRQRIVFAKRVSRGSSDFPADITIAGASTPHKGQSWFSFTDFCTIFLPEEQFEVTKDWRKTFKTHLKILAQELPNLYERDISVAIASEDPRSKLPNFWEVPGKTLKRQFYASAYPVIKTIVERTVPEITLVERFGSDSPYQRFKDSDKWALISFRCTKRQQVDIVQYVESRKLRFKCAILDLGFLENGYGKVAKIKEVIFAEVDVNSDPEKIFQIQSEFMARVIKELPRLIL